MPAARPPPAHQARSQVLLLPVTPDPTPAPALSPGPSAVSTRAESRTDPGPRCILHPWSLRVLGDLTPWPAESGKNTPGLDGVARSTQGRAPVPAWVERRPLVKACEVTAFPAASSSRQAQPRPPRGLPARRRVLPSLTEHPLRASAWRSPSGARGSERTGATCPVAALTAHRGRGAGSVTATARGTAARTRRPP